MRLSGEVSAEKIARNLAGVKARIIEAAQRSGRDASSIRLIGVTKYSSAAETAALIQLGVRDLGESRVQDAEKKIAALNDPALRWHLIGHLQTNKTLKAVKLFRTIHSLDSERLARAIDADALKADVNVECLIELNTAGEDNKFGLPPRQAELFELLKICSGLKALRISGLMSMAPYMEHPERSSRDIFKTVRGLLEAANAARVYTHPLAELSMGMTQDFCIAIEEGATMVRVGSALFE